MSFASDYRATPFWNDDAAYPAVSTAPWPAGADVVVVGAGYTGLAAARETALARRSTVVLDGGPIGGGASSRNGGHVAFSIKPECAELARRYGAETARRIYREGVDAMTELRALARTPGIDAGWHDAGCFYGAHTRRHFDRLRRAVESKTPGYETAVRVVPLNEQASEIDSPLYHGGLVFEDDAAVHPLKLLNVLHDRATTAGADVYDSCSVFGLTRTREGYGVHTARGVLRARQVLLATNGYTGPLSPWHRRRVISIGSYIIATEPLDEARVRRLIPRGRNVVDTRHVVTYVRPSPDGRRILFGGRAAAAERDVTRCVPRLVEMMAEVFPDLASARVSRAWMGFVGFTFDTLPHLGQRDGLFHCMGYCGQGVPLATYYGRRIGLRMTGNPAGQTAIEGLAFQARPFYDGRPWFVPAAIALFRLRDALGR